MTRTHLAGGDVETVVVGVKLDVQSRELLTWCLVKLVKPGDRLIAVHVMGHDEGVDPNGKSSFLSVVGAFDSVLNVYEEFCNLKQVDLKLKICRGSSIGTILVREAHSYSANKLILGTKHHKIRSSASVAKYCANNLSKNCSLLAVNNGKIICERVASTRVAKTKNSEGTDKHQRNTLLSILSRSTSFRLNLNSGANNCAICNPDPMFSSGLQDSDPSLLSLSSVAPLMMPLPIKDLVSNTNSSMTQKNFDDEDVHSDMDGENGDMIQDDANLPLDLAAFHERYSSTCRLFSYQELQSATSNFAPENLIGKGGSSQVYQGNFPNGKEIAVKILRQSEHVLRDFVFEIDITTSLHHKNIISLFGFCFEDNNKLLVYNLLPRGSLEEILHGKKNTVKFGWNERYKVAMGIAKALSYLHEFTSQTIIHRDVKSSNILLSDDFEPKLSDFGLAKRASASTQDTITDIAGTFGYLAPECFMYGKVTEKVDVYAYGVVLLELLSGRKPISSDHPKGQESLVMWATPMLNEGKITELLDPSLGPNHDLEMLERMILAASLCIRRSPQSRPKMSLVLKLIQGDKETMNWGRRQVNVTDNGLEKSFYDEGHLCPSYSAAGSRSFVADLRIAESKFIMASVIKSSDADLGIFGTDWVNPAPNLRKNLSLLSPSQVDLAKMLMESGQIYVFEHWPEPGHEDDQKLTFFEQVARLNASYPGGLVSYIKNARELLADSNAGKTPFDGFMPSVPNGENLTFGDENFIKYEEAGVREARNAAFVLVVGGLGERLGYNGIKVALPSESCTRTCFLQLYIESILALQEASCKLVKG